MSILSGLNGIIRQIRELTKSGDYNEKFPNEALHNPDNIEKIATGKIKLI